MDDLIRRQAAIDACIRVRMLQAYDEIDEIKALPSAEPVIRCRDCKHHDIQYDQDWCHGRRVTPEFFADMQKEGRVMEKRTYKKVMEVPTEMLVTEPVLVDKIKDLVKGELIDGIIGLMSNGNEYIVSLSNIIETQKYSGDFMSRFEQKINLVPLVRCKDCKHYDGRPCGYVDWYNTASDFCSRAERRQDERLD